MGGACGGGERVGRPLSFHGCSGVFGWEGAGPNLPLNRPRQSCAALWGQARAGGQRTGPGSPQSTQPPFLLLYPDAVCLSQDPCRRELYNVLTKVVQEKTQAADGLYKFYMPNCHSNGMYHSKQVSHGGGSPSRRATLPTTASRPKHAPRPPSLPCEEGPASGRGSSQPRGHHTGRSRHSPARGWGPGADS